MRAHRFAGAEYIGEVVGYITETREGYFRPEIGRVINTGEETDVDAKIEPIGSQPASRTLLEAYEAFRAGAGEGLAHVFLGPIKVGPWGVWLTELVMAEKRIDGR